MADNENKIVHSCPGCGQADSGHKQLQARAQILPDGQYNSVLILGPWPTKKEAIEFAYIMANVVNRDVMASAQELLMGEVSGHA